MPASRAARRSERRPRAVAVLTLIAGLAVVGLVATAAPASAAPTGVTVAPLLAAPGAPVLVSGAGCAGTVTVTAWEFTVGGVADGPGATVTAAPDGTWSATLTMPAGEALAVQAACPDAAVPVVVGSTGYPGSQWIAPALGTDQVVVERSGLVDGSLFRVVGTDGTALGEDVVEAGVGRVVLPYVPERDQVVALGVHPWTAGRFLPRALGVQMPIIAPATATPRVVTSGRVVTVRGTGCLTD